MLRRSSHLLASRTQSRWQLGSRSGLHQRMYHVFSASDPARAGQLDAWSKNEKLVKWIEDHVTLCSPDKVHLVDGSEKENADLFDLQVRTGSMIKLNEEIRPNSYLARSDVGDVARVEENTYICSADEGDAGPLNNWRDPEEMAADLESKFEGCMRGRTMYVVPFCMGPIGSPLASYGVQITDSPYVVVNMRIMARMGDAALKEIDARNSFIPCLHSLGAPLTEANQQDSTWPCSPDTKIITHFPETRRIISYGSGYGGNALLGKKCLALRIASVMARDEGWMAEHMLILGLTPPNGGKKRYVAAAFPSACGKTNLAMLEPTLPGWKVECVGDDIAWMRFGEDGTLRAINPEAGFFGVAPGTSDFTNPNAMRSMTENSIFTNVALTKEGDVWWEGMTKNVPENMVSWLRRDFEAGVSKFPAAHPNSRFTAPAAQCPVMDPAWEDPAGVPIDAIIFGGRRSSTVPLIYEAQNWQHGVFVGAVMTSETTAAAAGAMGVLRADPFAMKPFCGYNIGDYFQHWLNMEKNAPAGAKMPKIFHVNWFRKNDDGDFVWPGFGENSRVLKWVVDRCDATNEEGARPSAFGLVPTRDSLDLTGIEMSDAEFEDLTVANPAEVAKEARRAEEFLRSMGDRVPAEMFDEAAKLRARCEQ